MNELDVAPAQLYLDAAQVMMLALDLHGRVTLVNRYASAILGWSADELVGRDFIETCIPARLRDTTRQRISRVRSGDESSVENVVLAKCGAERLIEWRSTRLRDADGRVIGTLSSGTDITARKHAEEAQHRLAAIVNSSDDAIVGKTLQGIIASWNPGAERLFGFTAAEAVGQSTTILFPPELVNEQSTILARVTRGETVKPFDTVRMRKDGARVHVSVTISPVTDTDGRIIGASKIVRDISERKFAEDEARRLSDELEHRVVERTAQLEAANRELESFSYSVSHDLRAPLRAVNGFAGIVLEDYGQHLPDEGRRYLERIRAGGKRMGQLIDDLLGLSRLSRESMTMRTVDVEHLVRSALEETSPQQRDRQIDITVGDLPRCYGDPALLKQVWVNLLSNAVKYSRNRTPAVVEIGCRREQDDDVYFVRDNGVGFDMAYAHKLFGVFQRLHRADQFEGTGVGLAIVQRVVHRHGGRVWAYGEEDRGAVFHFTLSKESTQ